MCLNKKISFPYAHLDSTDVLFIEKRVYDIERNVFVQKLQNESFNLERKLFRSTGLLQVAAAAVKAHELIRRKIALKH